VAFNSSGNLIASVTCEFHKSSNEYVNYVNVYSFNELQEGAFKVFMIENMNVIHQIKFSQEGLLIFVKDDNNKCASYNIFDNNLVHLITPGKFDEGLSERGDRDRGRGKGKGKGFYSNNYNNYNSFSASEQKFELFNFGKTEDYFMIGSKEGKAYLWNTSTNYDKAYVVNILNHQILEENISNNLNSQVNSVRFWKGKNYVITAGREVALWKCKDL
jgi:hypothetical protein